ncbi:MAG: hypothetical protein ACPH4G_06655 [Henriciella sp.]
MNFKLSPTRRAKLEAIDAMPAIRSFNRTIRRLLRPALAVLGLVFILISIPISILTPLLPVGLPFMIAGVVLLGRNSVWGRQAMEALLKRFPHIERPAPRWLMKAVFGREKNGH